MVDRVGGDPDGGFAVLGEHGIAAIGVARAAREVAAGDVDLDPAAGAKRVADIAEIDDQRIDSSRLQMCAPATGSRYIARVIPSIISIARPSGSSSTSLATKSVSGQSEPMLSVTRTLPAIVMSAASGALQ